MAERPAPLSKAPDAREWLARRNQGELPPEVPERTELVHVDLAASQEALIAIERETPRLSDEDEARIARLSDREAQAERRSAHIALRIMLERFAGPRVRRRPYRLSAHGKPWLDVDDSSDSAATAKAVADADSPEAPASPSPTLPLQPHFSLSHTKGHALIGVSTRGPIGVDLELHRAPRIMGERRAAIERAGIELAGGAPLPEHDRDARFLTAWVRLEAIAKADGAGLGAHLSIILGRRARSTGGAASGGTAGLVARDIPMPAEGMRHLLLPKA